MSRFISLYLYFSNVTTESFHHELYLKGVDVPTELDRGLRSAVADDKFTIQ